jgi:hypothetical protein
MMKNENKKMRHWPSYARSIKREAGLKVKESDSNFTSLIKKGEKIEDPYYQAWTLTWIGRRMSDIGVDSTLVFSKSLKASVRVPQEWRRLEIFLQIISQINKIKLNNVDGLIYAINSFMNIDNQKKAIEGSKQIIKTYNLELSKIKKRKFNPNKLKKKYQPPRNNRVTLGIMNTYEGKSLRSIHIRTIARAVPLCYAYNLNLCLFNFPLDNEIDIATIVERESCIHNGSKYIKQLLSKGQLFIKKTPRSPISKEIGKIIATTSKPSIKKQITINRLKSDKTPYCVIMGLGKRGLPKRILELSHHHLEITGKNVSLETCTVMGILALILSSNRV